jgi:hypothetical protein
MKAAIVDVRGGEKMRRSWLVLLVVGHCRTPRFRTLTHINARQW